MRQTSAPTTPAERRVVFLRVEREDGEREGEIKEEIASDSLNWMTADCGRLISALFSSVSLCFIQRPFYFLCLRSFGSLPSHIYLFLSLSIYFFISLSFYFSVRLTLIPTKRTTHTTLLLINICTYPTYLPPSLPPSFLPSLRFDPSHMYPLLCFHHHRSIPFLPSSLPPSF